MRPALIVTLIWAGAALAQDASEPAFSTYPVEDQVWAITNRLAQDHACAMNDTIEADLLGAAFSREAVDTVKAQGEMQGAWTVLPSALCKIEMPHLQPELSSYDLEPFFRPAPMQEGIQEPGCFLNPTAMWRMLSERGLSDDVTNAQYLAFLSDGIRRNAVRFYSEDVLSTPIGFVDTKRECGVLPYREAMDRSHAVLVEHFDTYIRRNAAAVPCEAGASLMAPTSLALLDDLSEGQNTNAWLPFEVHILAWGAGWFEGVSYRDKGTPRPPLCRYP